MKPIPVYMKFFARSFETPEEEAARLKAEADGAAAANKDKKTFTQEEVNGLIAKRLS